MDAKTKAIIAHITPLGWFLALLLNQGANKEALSSYYIRQVMGVFLLGAALSYVKVFGFSLGIIAFVFWLLSLLGAIQGEEREVPAIGAYFQEWFKAL